MGLTNFPKGITSFGMPVVGSGSLPATTGSYFFVSSSVGTAGATGLSPEDALSTLNAAFLKCTAAKGDVIVVMPGHSETLATAGAITMDKSGVSVVGLGNGTLRPAFSLTATAASILVTAASISLSNLSFSSGVAELVTVFTVSAAGFTMDGCVVTPTATSMINFITGTAAADTMTIKNCFFKTTAIPTANSYFIALVGSDDLVFENNHSHVLTSNHSDSGLLGSTGTACLRQRIVGNFIFSTGTAVIPIRMLTASTGLVAHNRIGGTKTDAAGAIVNDGVYRFDNLTTNAVGASGFVDPAIDTAG